MKIWVFRLVSNKFWRQLGTKRYDTRWKGVFHALRFSICFSVQCERKSHLFRTQVQIPAPDFIPTVVSSVIGSMFRHSRSFSNPYCEQVFFLTILSSQGGRWTGDKGIAMIVCLMRLSISWMLQTTRKAFWYSRNCRRSSKMKCSVRKTRYGVVSTGFCIHLNTFAPPFFSYPAAGACALCPHQCKVLFFCWLHLKHYIFTVCDPTFEPEDQNSKVGSSASAEVVTSNESGQNGLPLCSLCGIFSTFILMICFRGRCEVILAGFMRVFIGRIAFPTFVRSEFPSPCDETRRESLAFSEENELNDLEASAPLFWSHHSGLIRKPKSFGSINMTESAESATFSSLASHVTDPESFLLPSSSGGTVSLPALLIWSQISTDFRAMEMVISGSIFALVPQLWARARPRGSGRQINRSCVGVIWKVCGGAYREVTSETRLRSALSNETPPRHNRGQIFSLISWCCRILGGLFSSPGWSSDWWKFRLHPRREEEIAKTSDPAQRLISCGASFPRKPWRILGERQPEPYGAGFCPGLFDGPKEIPPPIDGPVGPLGLISRAIFQRGKINRLQVISVHL